LIVFAALATAAGLTATGAAAPSTKVPRLIFPVLGKASFMDDFGDARWQGSHQGNDIMAPRRAIAVAAEPGKITFWTTSSAAGCMLYLYGKSGTTYLYIHLNNDLTKKNDNRGKCVAGVAYARGLRNGASVEAGQPIAFVGNSGDADGGDPHLHFEVHPNDGGATNPFPYLKQAERLIFPTAPQTAVTLSVSGAVKQAVAGQLSVKIAKLQVFPAGTPLAQVRKLLKLALSDSAQIDMGGGRLAGPQDFAALAGRGVIVLTEPTAATLAAAAARPGAFSVARAVVAP
jgi:hypothetical protein